MLSFGMLGIYGLAGVVLLLILFVLYAVNKSCVQTVEKLLKPEKVLEKIGAIDDPIFQTAESVLNEWTELKRFEHVGYFLCHTLANGESIRCGAWWSEKRRCYLMLYAAAKNMHYEFVSLYPDGGLVTSSGKDALVLPFPPGNYVQAFTDCNIDRLLAEHKKGQKTLKTRHNLTPQNAAPGSLYETMLKTLGRQAQYVQTLPFWRFRGAYWFFVKKHLLANRRVSG